MRPKFMQKVSTFLAQMAYIVVCFSELVFKKNFIIETQ